MTERYAAIYLRRSSADDANPGALSRDQQSAACTAVAAADGFPSPTVFEDWNRSADPALDNQRKAYQRLLSAIERDEIKVLYAAAVDRLYRSMGTYLRLLNAAVEHGTRIYTVREARDLIDNSPMGIAFGQMTATFSELELNTTKARNRGIAARRKKRGDAMGNPPYGQRAVRGKGNRIEWQDDPQRPLAAVLDAYRVAGNVMGAAKLLTAAGVKPPRGGKEWQNTSLTLILDRAGVLPPRNHRRTYSTASVLAGILRCHCGRTLTPAPSRNSYYCGRAHLVGVAEHGKMTANERVLLPLVRAEADRLAVPFDAVEVGADDPKGRGSLAERRRRVALAFADGALDEATYRAELAKIDATVERLDAAAEVVKLPPLNWNAGTAAVNAVLRAMFEYVQLDADMKITEVRWRVPEWRRA